MWVAQNLEHSEFLKNISNFFRQEERNGRLNLKRVFSDSVMVVSDYGGDHKESAFKTFTFVLFDADILKHWDTLRTNIRKNILKDNRVMCFKKLADKRRAIALDGFLDAANELSGVSISFCIHRDLLQFIFAGIEDIIQLQQVLRCKWKKKMLDNLWTTVQLVTLLTGGLVQDWQNILWVSDEDHFTGSHERKTEVAYLLRKSRELNHPTHRAEALFQSVAACPNDRTEMMFEDLCALPDLLAGALSEVWSAAYRKSRLTSDCGEYPIELDNVSEKAAKIFDWHLIQGVHLRKVTCLLVPSQKDGIKYEFLIPSIQ